MALIAATSFLACFLRILFSSVVIYPSHTVRPTQRCNETCSVMPRSTPPRACSFVIFPLTLKAQDANCQVERGLFCCSIDRSCHPQSTHDHWEGAFPVGGKKQFRITRWQNHHATSSPKSRRKRLYSVKTWLSAIVFSSPFPSAIDDNRSRWFWNILCPPLGIDACGYLYRFHRVYRVHRSHYSRYT